MFEWNINNIIDATGGTDVNGCNWIHSSNISTDTRSVKKGDLFIALKGKNFDGHNFLHEAFLKGAAAAIVSEGKYKNFPLIIVQDTLKALHGMASYYIRNVLVDAKVIAITGSVGKTTTKDMLHTHQENKITDSDFAIKRIRGKRLFVLEGSLEIDNSNLSAKEIAKRIVKRMNNRKKLVKTSVNNLTKRTRG